MAFLRDLGGLPRCCTGGAAQAVWAGLAEGVTGHVGTAVRISLALNPNLNPNPNPKP